MVLGVGRWRRTIEGKRRADHGGGGVVSLVVVFFSLDLVQTINRW